MECAAVFVFNDTATTEIYTLSLHDALPIYPGLARNPRCCSAPASAAGEGGHRQGEDAGPVDRPVSRTLRRQDRKSTRLNSSHANISYAVFCLKKLYGPSVARTPPSHPSLPL